MPEPEPLEADVFLDAHIPADQERVLVDAFSALGVTAHTRIAPTRRGLSELHWTVLVALPLHAFLSSVGGKLAEDAYRGFKGAIRRLLGGGQPAAEKRPMVLQDTATGLQVVLEPGLPDDGYQQLLGLDLSQFQLGPVHYDHQLRRWRSELDEARRTT